MTFLQIMRAAYIARKAGVSAATAIMAACENDDRNWEILFERLMLTARLEKSLGRFRKKGAA